MADIKEVPLKKIVLEWGYNNKKEFSSYQDLNNFLFNHKIEGYNAHMIFGEDEDEKDESN